MGSTIEDLMFRTLKVWEICLEWLENHNWVKKYKNMAKSKSFFLAIIYENESDRANTNHAFVLCRCQTQQNCFVVNIIPGSHWFETKWQNQILEYSLTIVPLSCLLILELLAHILQILWPINHWKTMINRGQQISRWRLLGGFLFNWLDSSCLK